MGLASAVLSPLVGRGRSFIGRRRRCDFHHHDVRRAASLDLDRLGDRVHDVRRSFRIDCHRICACRFAKYFGRPEVNPVQLKN